MSKVSFVIGAMASGKTHFIEHFFADKDVDVLNILTINKMHIKNLDLEK